MMDIKVNAAKSFFRSQGLLSKAERAQGAALRKMGAFIQTRARRSIRPARMMRVSEMTDEQRQKYEQRVAIARSKGQPKPKRPLASSDPGDPPRSITKLLRKFIFYVVDYRKRTVVVGPAKLNRPSVDALEALEYGGRSRDVDGNSINIDARPFMHPAREAEQDKFDSLFRNAIR